MGILSALPPSHLSGECRENVNRRAHGNTRTKPEICNGGIGAGLEGGRGNQKVYVTQDIRDKSLEAQCERSHARHKEAA